jgi:hypothetical protein
MTEDVMDSPVIGELCLRIMERVDAKYGDEAVVRDVALIVEIDGRDATFIEVACSDDRPRNQRSLLEAGLDWIDDRLEVLIELERDDDD